MNADSIVQYQQALYGKFDDWHPPLMSILLYSILKLGGSLSLISFFQSIFACFGVFLLAREILKVLNTPVEDKKVDLYAFLILLILLSPLSALPFYAMSYIKDAWLALTLVWLVYFFLLLQNKNRSITQLQFWITVGLLLSAMVVSLLLRHNSMVLLPVYFIMLFQTLRNNWEKSENNKLKSKALRFAIFSTIAVLPYIIYLIISSSLYSSFEVAKTHPENQVVAMESLGVLIEDPELKEQLTYLSSHLTEEHEQAYIAGNVAPIMPWGPIKAVDENFDRNNPKLKQEYFSLYTSNPFVLIKVKWDGFKNMLFPAYRYWFHPQLDENALGLEQNKSFKNIRDFWISISEKVYSNSFFNKLFAEHIVWVLINLGLLIWILYTRRKKVFPPFLFIIVLLPFSYYLSYLLASTGPQYRFMYPATLVLQIVVLGLFLDFILKKQKIAKHI